MSSQYPIDFSTVQLANGSLGPKIKAHGSLMVIAWILVGSLGMFIARYCKFIFSDHMINGLMIWFFLHRPMMVLAFVLTLISLVVILVENNWNWVNKANLTAFVHSIFGLVLIGFLTLQVCFYFFLVRASEFLEINFF